MSTVFPVPGIVPAWINGGPNPVVIGGGGQAVECWLIGNPSYGRASGSSASASAGTGGWQVTDATRQKAKTEWLDYYPIAMSMKLRVDVNRAGAPDNGSLDPNVDGACAVLESFEVPTPGSRPPLPPIISIWGPVPHTELFWVCSRLDFLGGEGDVIVNAAGARTMQQVQLELTEYSPSSVIQSNLTPAQQAAQVGASGIGGGVTSGSTTLAASGKTYTVVAGDTLQSIAANVLGNVAAWVNIALLNGLAYGSVLTPGRVLQLPAS